MFTHPITLHSVSGEESETLEALVDTDTLFAVFPAGVLERLGLEPRDLRGGQAIGQVEAQLGDHRGPAMCVFGAADEPARIGRRTLDTFLLEADGDNRKLVPKTFRVVKHI